MASSAPGPPARGPEAEVLLVCARRRLEPDDAARVRAALRSGAVDWERLHRLAARNRVIPLLARHLSAFAGDGVPADFLARAGAEAADAARRALRLAAELVRLLDAFAAAGARACAYKGPALAARAYGDLGLRDMSDLDVLVHPADTDAALRVLEARGYRPRFRFTPRQDALFRRTDGDYPFTHPETGTLVELHTRVSPARFAVRLETEDLLARVVPVRVGGGEVPALADGDLFLALAVHGAKHRWERLEWLSAFAELVREGAAELDDALARAERAGARRTVLLALLLAHDLLGAPVPAAILESARDDGALPRLAAEAASRILHDSPSGPAEADTTAANLAYNLRLRDGAADRLRFAFRWLLVPSPEDWESITLPNALFFMYRVMRPVRLAWRYRPRIFSR